MRGVTSPQPRDHSLASLRGQLTNIRALLVLSILMTESADDGQILRLAASSAASLSAWRIAGFLIGDTWRPGTHATDAMSAALIEQVRSLPEAAR